MLIESGTLIVYTLIGQPVGYMGILVDNFTGDNSRYIALSKPILEIRNQDPKTKEVRLSYMAIPGCNAKSHFIINQDTSPGAIIAYPDNETTTTYTTHSAKVYSGIHLA